MFEPDVAIVTGSGRGIGRAVATHLATQGMRVVVNDIGAGLGEQSSDPSVAAAVADEIREAGGDAIWNSHSVATVEGADQLVADAVGAYGRVDLLVNNAGVMRDVSFLEMSDTDWDLVYEVNLKGTFACTRAAARIMAGQGEGRVVNMSSINALGISSRSATISTRANYSAAKAGVLGLTWALATELAPAGITATAVFPTATTRLMEAARARREATGEAVPEHARVATRDPMSVARLVGALARAQASSVNGRIFHIDGELVRILGRPEAVASFHLGDELTVLEGMARLEDAVAATTPDAPTAPGPRA